MPKTNGGERWRGVYEQRITGALGSMGDNAFYGCEKISHEVPLAFYREDHFRHPSL